MLNPTHTTLAWSVFAGLLVLAGKAPAAEVDEATALMKPETTVEAGIGHVSRDNGRFGQYSGLRDEGVYGLFDVNLVNRDDATGAWFLVNGRDLGLTSRELRLEHSRQGDWGYFLDYRQIPRYEPYTANTAVGGVGSPALVVPSTPTAGSPTQLQTERDIIGLGASKSLSDTVSVQLRFHNETKNGERIFARGTTGTSGGLSVMQFTPEPIDSSTRQIEATVDYAGKQLQLSGGYYGTAYNNHNPRLDITEAGAATGLSGFTPIALPPDNQSHQIFMAGGYSLSATTRATFKAAYARATQNDSFILPSSTGRTDLGGRVDTTSLQAGISARPISKLTLLANLRYEDRDDKTPVVDYFPVTTGTTFTGENEPRSIKTTNGKVEAGYALPHEFRVTGGVDYEEKKRNFSAVRAVSAREQTEETAYRLGVRRPLGETVTGSFTFIHSNRTGSDFLTTTLTTGASGSNLIAPLHLADRDRDKVRLALDWSPLEALSFQLGAERADDDYSARTAQNLGPRAGKAENYALDATYVFSETLQANAWVSYNDNRIDQTTCENASGAGVCPANAADPIWQANLRSSGDAIGLGARGKPSKRIDLGADLEYFRFRDEFGQQAITAGATIAPVPDINTRLTRLRLWTKYALQKNAGVGINYAYERWHTDDWTWTSWTYLDGTQLTQAPTQKVHFIGVSAYYRWQ